MPSDSEDSQYGNSRLGSFLRTMPGPSLVNVGELTKPATVLIKKISNAVGTLWEPKQIRRVAQAKADAAMTLARSGIEIGEVQRRAAQRFVEEETRNQQNMESIGTKAIPNLNPEAPTEDVEDDWITNFFDKCRTVSDDDMQDLWSRILAGEANSPGSFSRKTVNLVADLDKSSAELFVSLCRFGWRIGDGFWPLVLDFNEQIYKQHGIDLFSLGQLDSIGLVQIGDLGFVATNQPGETVATYCNRSVSLKFRNEAGNELKVGHVLLTPPGAQLSGIVEPKPIEGFFEFVYDRWERESLVPAMAKESGTAE